jgi:hypothetical protein
MQPVQPTSMQWHWQTQLHLLLQTTLNLIFQIFNQLVLHLQTVLTFSLHMNSKVQLDQQDRLAQLARQAQ